MFPNLDFVRQMEEDEREIQEYLAANPEVPDLLSVMFSFLPNVVASVIDEDAEYDPDLTYATLLADQGMHWIPAGVLGTALDWLEPGPGEFVRAGSAISSAFAPVLFRLQNRATGLGPFQGIPSNVFARGNQPGLRADYYAANPDYAHRALMDLPYSVQKESDVLISTPVEGARVLDITRPDEMDMGTFKALAEQVGASGLPDETLEYLLGIFNSVMRGEALPYQAVRSTQRAGGFGMAGAPHRAGIDRLVQYPDDNLSAVYMERAGQLGNFDPRQAEHVVFNPESVVTEQVIPAEVFYDLMQFAQDVDAERLLRSRSEFLVNPLRAVGRGTFRSLGPDEVSRYAEAVRSMDPSKRGFLTPYSADDLKRMVGEGYEVFYDDRGIGYILSPDKDLQGVINASGIRGAGEEAIWDAISRGAVTLDAFDGHLPDYYRRFGFEEVGRAKFDPQYAPPDWDYDRYGTPDVVFMRLRGR